MSTWFVLQNDRNYGPFSADVMRSLASNGKLAPTALIARSATGPWQPLARVRGLPAAEGAPAPAPTSPAAIAPGMDGAARRADIEVAPGVIASIGMTDAERPLWSGRPSQWINLKVFAVCAVLSVLVVPLFVAAWYWLSVRCTRHELTTQRLKRVEGVLARRQHEIELYRVRESSVQQGFLQRLLRVATVRLQTSDPAQPVIEIACIPAADATRVREQVRTLVEELRAGRVSRTDGF